MRGQSQRAYQRQSAKVYDRREQKGIGAAGGVAAKKIAGAPGEDGGQSVGGGCDVGRGGHVRRGYHAPCC